MLVLQIAAGIVLAVLVLAYWPRIVALTIWLALAALALGVLAILALGAGWVWRGLAQAWTLYPALQALPAVAITAAVLGYACVVLKRFVGGLGNWREPWS